MPQIINTNSLSLLAQNNLNSSQLSLNSAIQRLSSGLRINSAKDDAAGQAIANRFTANVRGLTQAQRNANDGISISQTTEGALKEVNNNLQRIRELAVQAANGTNSTADKASIQAEISQRLAEINRTSAQTDFNGVKVLSSSASTLTVQVGANDGETIDIGLTEISTTTLGLNGFTVKTNALDVSDKITEILDSTAGNPSAAVDFDTNVVTQLAAYYPNKTFTADDLTLHEVQDANGAGTGQYVVKAGDEFFAATVERDNAGLITLNTADVEFTDSDNGITNAVTLTDQLVKVSYDAAGAATGYVTVQGKNFEVTDATVLDDAGDGTGTLNVAQGPYELSGATATAEFEGAATADPLEKLDAALKIVDDLRGELGAVQNRFDSIIANLSITVNNLSASRSRIEDADFAVEVSNMTRAQILQQAGTSVLAQANQSTQNVLSLLR